MQPTHRLPLLLALLTLGLSVAHVAAQETKIAMRDLPPAVQQAVHAETANARIRAISKETTNGKTRFEVETTVSGHERDLLFDSNGTLIEAEESLATADVPAAVTAALAKEGPVRRVERVTRGTTIAYEAVVMKHGKPTEVAVRPDGTLVPAHK